ncbi:phage GP46 family protein [Kaistia dalseonensis]|uniref:Phage gp46-like protein n=1 Tax=Kaistia dalseonensis TaxID=410840 RepID=A0ABU0HAN0_9HYPH|nr:phage GP46 family protein [Kaistia dalseonensis]MCX5496427.1 phage GP46 family protein [Kaistia dalseonensis]MDQ0439047.1 phage gp46-like protein [Kaistia dalseonensis]
MVDIKTLQTVSLEAITTDWLVGSSGALEDGDDLATAFVIALLTDRSALDGDELPDDTGDRRGWWADLDAEAIWNGWPIGSRLWLLSRHKILDETVTLAEGYCREALQPFIDRHIVSRIDIALERLGAEMIGGSITAYRGPAKAVDLRFETLWNNIRSR